MTDIATIEDDVSHIEIAFVTFDQWILTIVIRVYNKNQSVKGMVHLIFKGVRGFRYLDESDMLKFPFPEKIGSKYFSTIENNGWSQQETEYGNIVISGHNEYLVVTDNECVSILSYNEPIIIKEN